MAAGSGRGVHESNPHAPAIIDVIASGEVRLVVNTPIAGARSLEPGIRAAIDRVRSLGEWQPAFAADDARESARMIAAVSPAAS